MKTCWTCRRRRLKCDGLEQLSTCKRCVNDSIQCYSEKPLKWAGNFFVKESETEPPARTSAAIAINKSSELPQRLDSSQDRLHRKGHSIGVASSRKLLPNVSSRSTKSHGDSRVAIARPLIDPIFKDLNQDVRFFVHYYETRSCSVLVLRDSVSKNPFKTVIPLIGSSPSVLSAMMAISTCHFAHEITRMPICSPSRVLGGGLQQEMIAFSNSTAATSKVLGSFFFWKHRALQQLAEAMSAPTEQLKVSTLATAILLLVLELWESGAESWNIHLEGVKRLLAAGSSSQQLSLLGGLDDIIDSLIPFETFGTTLSRPGSMTESLRLSFSRKPGTETPESSVVGCPNQILLAIDSVTARRHNLDNDASPDASIIAIEAALYTVQNFDVLQWTLGMSQADSGVTPITQANLFSMCQIWRLSAEIYICRVLVRLKQDTAILDLLPGLVDDLIATISLVSHNDELIKCLIWPTFIAGTEGTSLEHQQCVLRFLDRQWDITLGANARSAASVLKSLWHKHAQLKQLGNGAKVTWDWMQELSKREDNWLFF